MIWRGGDSHECPKKLPYVFISSLKMCNIALIDLLKGDAQAKNNIITTSVTNMQERDVKDSHSGCFGCRYHINEIIKAVQHSERDSCLCI